MDIKNPYIVSLCSGGLVYIMYSKNLPENSTDAKKKEVKQMKLNYAFLTSLVVFLVMQYYSNSTVEIEPVLKTKFED